MKSQQLYRRAGSIERNGSPGAGAFPWTPCGRWKGGDSIPAQSPAPVTRGPTAGSQPSPRCSAEPPSHLRNPDSPALRSAVAGETEPIHRYGSAGVSLLMRDLLLLRYFPALTKAAHLLFSNRATTTTKKIPLAQPLSFQGPRCRISLR